MTKSYANFNNVTFQGRIFDATIAKGQYGEFVSLTIITNLVNDDDGVTITFNNSNGLLKLAQDGYLVRGRQVHVTGHITGVSEIYEKDGELAQRKRPQITLDSKSAQLTLGATPAADKPAVGTKVIRKAIKQAPAVDPTPTVINNDTPAAAVDALFWWPLAPNGALSFTFF